MISHITLALFLLVACNSNATQQNTHCKRLVTKDHLKNLSDLMDTQMKSSCQLSFNYVEESDLNHHICFVKAAYRPLGDLLRNEMKFKKNTTNFEIQHALLQSHEYLDKDCFKTKADESQSSARCIKKLSLSAEEMLKLVHRYFSLAAELIFKEENFSQDCSSIFEKCSDLHDEATSSSGVVTDQDCKCSATVLIPQGLATSFLPTSESLPSVAHQLDSKETAASTLELFRLLGTTQTQGQPEGSTRPRVPRSTYKGPNMDFGSAAHTAISSEELALAAVLQGPDSVAFQDSALTPHPWFPRPSNIPPSLSSQQQSESMGTESTLPGSGAGSNQIWPSESPSQHLFLSGLAKPSPNNQWLQTRVVDKAISEFASDLGGRTDSSSTSSLSLESFATLEPLDSSGRAFSRSWAVLPPSDPPLFPILGSEEPLSVTQQPFKASPRLIPLESNSWGDQGSRGRAPGIQQSTQLRERRAGREEEGLAKDREPEDNLSGPNFDLSFIPPNTDKSSKNPELRDSQRMALIYVLGPSILGILLAVGGLLFYLHRSRMLTRRRQQRVGSNMEEQEGSPLRAEEEHLELQIQGEL
ncbi:macrophage colony-stimulating factor 1 [Eublepharis macularius]|uniref:Macrophage colony-stimulating factor 1 n=1 Tax=Eublepharis macularius TaxID=481883 RepID=A0AA97JFR2_EUBMA|nr:macrophage colony-stimulating factor 1 [Eublepharis macularius]